jgi:hypothetical protein
MTLRKFLTIIFPILFMLPIVIQYFRLGFWLALLLVGLNMVLWIMARNKSDTVYVHAALFLSTSIIIGGWLTASLPFYGLILSSSLVLINWDLVQFDRELSLAASTRAVFLEQKHLTSLIFILLFGLLLGLSGYWFRLNFPFGIILILISAALYCLDYIWRKLKST